jgi:hypothetical protein
MSYKKIEYIEMVAWYVEPLGTCSSIITTLANCLYLYI